MALITRQSVDAPPDAQYVTLALHADLTVERVLTGTANQIVVTDGGAGAAVTLSCPQDIHAVATPQFANLGLGQAANATRLSFPAATAAAGGIDFGGDVTLYRSAANVLKTDDELNIGAVLRVTGISYFDEDVHLKVSARLWDNRQLMFGSDYDCRLVWSTLQATEHTLLWGLGDTAQSVILTTKALLIAGKNFDHAAQANPTLFVHSATDPDTANTQWLSLTHDQANGVIATGLGDIVLSPAGSVVLPKTSGKGLKVDTATPTFGWRDITGKIRRRGTGAANPTDAVYIGGSVKAWQFAVNDEVWLDFHIPHDHVPGTDIHLHFHWSHNSADVTGGNVTWGAHITYAKGHDQAAFIAEVNPTVTPDASTIQYRHLVSEVQISASTPSGTQIDTDNIEPDGLVLVHAYLSANNMTASNGVPDPFLHEVDIHYQSTNIATKDKAPDFYA